MDERGMKERDTSRQIIGTTADIVAATKSNELKSTYRVYQMQWLPTASRNKASELSELYLAKYEGRVRTEDIEMVGNLELHVHTLNLRLWNVVGEWKSKELADDHRDEILEDLCVHEPRVGGWCHDCDGEVEVVARNSRREHTLLAYGKLKLPDATPAPVPG